MSISPVSNSNEKHPLFENRFQSFSDVEQTQRVFHERKGDIVSTPVGCPLSSQRIKAQIKLTLPNGEYIGEVEENEPHGEGTLNYKPGMELKKYEGDWRNGQFWGRGILTFANRSRYEGEFERGWPHGKGFAIFPDGVKFEGGFECGHVQGKGKVYKRNGQIEHGKWRNGYRVIVPFPDLVEFSQQVEFFQQVEYRFSEKREFELFE